MHPLVGAEEVEHATELQEGGDSALGEGKADDGREVETSEREELYSWVVELTVGVCMVGRLITCP